MHSAAPIQYFLKMPHLGTSMRNAGPQKPPLLPTKTKAALVEPLLVAKVVLCWIVGLPIFVLCFCATAIWDHAVSWWARSTNRQDSGARFASLPNPARVPARPRVR
jgi:hypothetical protein